MRVRVRSPSLRRPGTYCRPREALIKTIRIATLVLLALLALGCDDMLQHDHPEEPTPPDPRTGPPSWTDNTGPTQTWTRGTAISTFTVPPVDAGSPAPTYSASGLPSGLRFHPSARRITGTPTVAGTGMITVMATNTAGTATWTMAWTVTALPPEPEPEPDPDLDLNADREILLAAQYVLDEGGLGWNARTPVDEWVGVWVDGSPKRVAGLSLYRGLTGELSGEIPASLGGLSELKHLGLSGGLSGKIPASLGRLSKLEDLSLGGNDLSGEIPASLGNLSDLYSLSLRYNDLDGEIPAWFGNLPKLHFLDIDGSGLDGCLPSALRSRLNQGGSDIDWYAFCDDVPPPPPDPRSEFDIDIHYLGLTSAAIGRSHVNGRSSGRVSVVQNEIERAVTWWESKITGDIPDEPLSMSFFCGREVSWFVNGQTIDDIAVIVEIGTDAPRNGGRAFVCHARGYGGTYPPEGFALPLLARIVIHEDWIRGVGESYAFDGPGRIEKLVRHELGHALGFDRDVFRALDLTEVANGQWRFTGATARAQFARTNLPWEVADVKQYGVPLTSDESHLPFYNQIMSPSAPWEESLLTLAMMKDLGYPGVVLP